MTQPRKHQIKSVNTRFATFNVSATPGSYSTSVSPGSINPFLVTDAPGGAQSNCQATVLGTVSEPFTIIAGDSINVNRDGAGSVLVTFTALDVGASKIAARINAALANTAVNEGGKIRISSTGVGSATTVVLSDGVAGTLAKLGLTAGTFTGVNEDTRGVLTKTPDNLGGYVKLRGQDGKEILADNPFTRQNGPVGTDVTKIPELFGGMPVHGRIGYDGTNYQLGYYVRVPSHASVVTGDSRFDLLDATDNFQIIVDGTYTISNIDFPAPPYTVTQVVDRINKVYGDTVAGGGNDGRAMILGAVSQPFNLSGSMTMKVDGGSPVTFPITISNATAAQVAALIQAAVPGITCDTVSLSGKILVRIRSNNTDGRTSSLEVSVTSASNPSLQELGIAPGLYRGHFIAELYGTNSIKISSPQRGSSSSLVVSGTGQTLTRMGLTAATHIGSDNAVTEPIQFPTPTWAPGGVVPISCLIPESLEFGEVPPGSEAVLLEGIDSASGANQNLPGQEFSGASIENRYRGVRDVGKPVILGPDGLVDPGVLRKVTDPIVNTLKKMIDGDPTSSTVNGIVANAIVGSGSLGNPISAVNAMTMDVDPTGSFAGAFRTLDVRFSRDGSPVTPFRMSHFGANLYGATYGLSFPLANTVLAAGTGSLLLSDANIVTGLLTESNRTLALSGSSNGDQYLRVNEVLAKASIYGSASLLRKVNSIFTVTVGDGTLSFGDFSGPTAIQQAIAFHTTNNVSASVLRVQVKEGNYTVSTGNPITIPNKTVIIEGISPMTGVGASISRSDSTTSFIDATLTQSRLTLRGVKIANGGGNYGIIDFRGTDLVVEDCALTGIRTLAENCNITVRRTTYSHAGTSDGAFVHHLFDSITNPNRTALFEEVTMAPVPDRPSYMVESDNAIAGIVYLEATFKDCYLTTGAITTDTGNLFRDNGVIGLAPANTNPATTGTGVKIKKLRYENCKVRSSFGATGSVLMHVTTKENADNSDAVNNRIPITRVEIVGGSWLAFRGSSAINPFTLIGVADQDYANPPNDETGGIFVRDVEFGFSFNGSLTGVSHGSATSDIANEFGGSTVPANAQWGAFVFGGRVIDMDGVKYVGGSQNSNSSDMVFRWDRCSLRNFHFERFTSGGPGSIPTSRVRFRPYSSTTEYLTVQNWRFSGSGTAMINAVGSAFLLPEPNSTGRSQATSSFIRFSGITIQGFGSQAGSAIKLEGDLVSGSLYTSSPNHYRNVTIDKFDITQFTRAIYYSSGTDGNFISNVKITDCDVGDCNGAGVWIVATPTVSTPWDWVVVDRNTVRDCSLLGITVTSEVWTQGGVNAVITITNNMCQVNGGSNTGTHIWAGCASGGVASQNPRGVIMGNSCGVGSGRIICFQTSAGGVVQALTSPAVPAAVPMRGLETSYDTTVTPASMSARNFADGAAMLQNNAVLDNTP